MSLTPPNIPEIDTNFFKLNLTAVLSMLVFCLSALAGVFKLIGNNKKQSESEIKDPNNIPGTSVYCKQNLEKLSELKKSHEENNFKIEQLRAITNNIDREIGVLKNESENMGKTITEMKQSNKEIAARLDKLLQQIMEWMSQD